MINLKEIVCLWYSFSDLQKPQGELDGKACAAVGQSSLMALYDTMFSQVATKLSCLIQYCFIFFSYCIFKWFCCFLHIDADMRFFWVQLDVTSSQLLVNDGFFRDAGFRKQLSDTVNALLDLRVIPIFNENDAVSTRKAPYEVGWFFLLCFIWIISTFYFKKF